MMVKSFAELTKQVHLLNDLILSDIVCVSSDYAEESLSFSRHLFATKYWFVRTSFANKRRYILALLEDVRSAWALSLLLKSLWNCRPKDAVLSISGPHVLSLYDQAPMDHNRTALPISTLGQVMTTDRKWFHSLEPETQALVLSELLTIAGGPIMWEVLRRGQSIYERHREQQLRDLLECIVVENQKPRPTSQHQQVDLEKEKEKEKEKSANRLSLQKSASTSGTKMSKLTLVQGSETTQRELEESLAAWNKLINGIRANQKLEELEMTFKDGTKKKIWKVNRPKPEGFETVDFIQLLPSTVAKRILSYLPRSQFSDYAKVNRYWDYLIHELDDELSMRKKLNTDLQHLQEILLKHDMSLEVLQPSTVVLVTASAGASLSPSTRRGLVPSYRASEKSTGGVSFRHLVVEKLKPAHKFKPKSFRRLADLTERLEKRGAADENIFQWCENVLKYYKGRHPKAKREEGVLRFGTMHFPCPLMKHSLTLPPPEPLLRDPAHPTAGLKHARRNFSYTSVVNVQKEANKRFSLWSRDFSSLYKVVKVASYQSPI